MDQRSRKKKAILDRIESIEAALVRAREYLESGKHAHWSGFRPLFARKERDGKELPPHKDWVKNVFLPRREKALRRAEKALERLTGDDPRVPVAKPLQPAAEPRSLGRSERRRR